MVENIELNGYELSRRWFDFSFKNPELISPGHTAIYFFSIEHCNRMGWKDKFGFPSQMTMDAVGISRYSTYSKYFNDLVEWGFFKIINKSSNQYSANIISIQTAMPKIGKALDKALIKHCTKQRESTVQSTAMTNGSIIEQYNKEQYNKEQWEDVVIENKNENFEVPETLIPAMLKIWLEKTPKYFQDKDKDSHALFKIAKDISMILGIKPLAISRDHSDEHAIKLRWGEIVTFIQSENFFRSYSLAQVEKHFQSILLRKDNQNSQLKSKNTGDASTARKIENDKANKVLGITE